MHSELPKTSDWTNDGSDGLLTTMDTQSEDFNIAAEHWRECHPNSTLIFLDFEDFVIAGATSPTHAFPPRLTGLRKYWAEEGMYTDMDPNSGMVDQLSDTMERSISDDDLASIKDCTERQAIIINIDAEEGSVSYSIYKLVVLH